MKSELWYRASINNESDFDKVADALIIQHPRIHLRESRKRPKEKGKDTHRLREGGKRSGNGKSATSTCYTNFNFFEDDTVERADTYQAHSDPSNFGGDGREEVLGYAVYEKATRFLHMLLLTTSLFFETARLDAFAPLADRQENDLDPGS